MREFQWRWEVAGLCTTTNPWSCWWTWPETRSPPVSRSGSGARCPRGEQRLLQDQFDVKWYSRYVAKQGFLDLTAHDYQLVFGVEVYRKGLYRITAHYGPYILKVGWFSCPAKKLTKSPGLPQPNFTKWLWFLAIFHTPWVCWGVWKIAKPQYFCTVWPVEVRD